MWEVLQGDVRDKLQDIPQKSIQCVVTSPPYWGLRDYGAEGQLGLEPTPEEYVNNMVEVFRGVWRALRDDGVLWLNLGDSYFAKPKSNYDGIAPGLQSKNYGTGDTRLGYKQQADKFKSLLASGYKNKDLVGIPWSVAFALRDDGWYLRMDIIWNKKNPMPESVTDRPTKAHEYIFLLSKNQKYFYDSEAVKERGQMQSAGSKQRDTRETHGMGGGNSGINVAKQRMKKELEEKGYVMRNKRSVWTVATQPYPGSHFAVFPPKLIEPCILAGSRPGDTVLDPFAGSGTTLWVAESHGRDSKGIELNSEYVKLIEKRMSNFQQTIFSL